MNASKPEEGFQCLVKREENVECFVDHWDDHFYALTTGSTNGDYVVRGFIRF